jgi:hypothetical protein
VAKTQADRDLERWTSGKEQRQALIAELERRPHEEQVARGAELRRRLGTAAPKAVVRMSGNAGAGLRRAFDGQALDEWTYCQAEGVALPIYVRLGETPTGEIVATGLVIGPREQDTRDRKARPMSIIRAQDLRIPLAAIVGEMAGVWKRTGIGAGPAGLSGARARPGKKGRGDQFYRDVAAQYRKAMKDHPATPTKALFHSTFPMVKPSTVKLWLRVARERGFLGRAEQGRPGEGAERKVGRGKARKR